jgi:hypothetical protein
MTPEEIARQIVERAVGETVVDLGGGKWAKVKNVDMERVYASIAAALHSERQRAAATVKAALTDATLLGVPLDATEPKVQLAVRTVVAAIVERLRAS